MSYYSAGEPFKVGSLIELKIPDGHPAEKLEDMFKPFEMVFADGLARGLIDRPVELVVREIDGLPKGSVKAVIDAYEELVDEGCVVVLGPHIADNAVATKAAIEERFHVPSISMTGTDDFLGEWTFALPMGSHSDEPMFIAHMLHEAGLTEVGCLAEQSVVGDLCMKNFQTATRVEGVRIVAAEAVPQIADEVDDAVRKLRDAKAQAIVFFGFGLGIVNVNAALEKLAWDPPRYLNTAFQNAWMSDVLWHAILGWTGVDQFDEGNPTAAAFLDRYEVETGRRPAYSGPLQHRDVATAALHGIANAHPVSPRGVRDGLERVKMIPAACGSAGTRISFGKWTRRGWMGSQYLVARRLLPEGLRTGLTATELVARFGVD